MNTCLLRKASYRRIGFRSWQCDGRKITLAVPRLGMWPSGPLKGGHLSWSVDGGKRGLNITMHRKLAEGVVRDIINGTNNTRYDHPL